MRNLNWGYVSTVARTDLKQLIQAKDFWVPMTILGGLFFVIIPTLLLTTITRIGDVELMAQISETLEVLPADAQEKLQGQSPEGRAG